MGMLVAKCHGEGGQGGSRSDLGQWDNAETTWLGWIVLALRWLLTGDFGRNFALLKAYHEIWAGH